MDIIIYTIFLKILEPFFIALISIFRHFFSHYYRILHLSPKNRKRLFSDLNRKSRFGQDFPRTGSCLFFTHNTLLALSVPVSFVLLEKIHPVSVNLLIGKLYDFVLPQRPAQKVSIWFFPSNPLSSSPVVSI